MMMTDAYGLVPGITTSRETYEAEFRWGSQWQGIFANGLISGAARDTGNSPTYELRSGLLLAQLIADGKYVAYSPTGANGVGSEVASAVLIESIRTQDFEGTDRDRFYAVLVGGPVQTAKILNLDLQARQQMDKFIFDDSSNLGSISGNHWYPWRRQLTKTSNYTILNTDNFTLFDNAGAGGTVVLTLPTLANGYFFGLYAMAAQVLRFTSSEGSNVVGGGSLTNTSCSVTAIGGAIYIYSNPGATKWIVEQHGTQTITFA